MSSQDIFSLIDKLGQTANTLHERVFVSPIYHNRWVATRIDKIVYRFEVNRLSPGWYKFQPTSNNKAKSIGTAELMDIEQYLKIFDKLRLIMIRREGDQIFGIPFKTNKYDFECTQIFPVFLSLDDIALEFDEILCRFDGVNVWYEQVPMNNDPSRSEYLRDSLNNRVEPSNLAFQGLRFEDKIAYGIRYQLMVEEEERIRRQEEEERARLRRAAKAERDQIRREEQERLMRDSHARLKRAVEHGGGVFRSFTERGSNFNVTYVVDGETYTSTIAKDRNLTVLTAGFCLSGHDRDFDLSSLISVIREGQNRDLIHRW